MGNGILCDNAQGTVEVDFTGEVREDFQ
jgi:hypothetical protein